MRTTPTAPARARDDRARALVRSALTARWRTLAVACLLCVVHQAAEAAVPLAIGIVVDRAVEPGSARALLWSLVGLCVLFLVLSSSMRLGGKLAKGAAEGAEHDLRLAVTARVLAPRGLPAAASRSGELLSTATSDAARVSMMNAAVWFGAGAVGAVAVAAVILFRTSVTLGLLVLAGLVPVVLVSRVVAAPLIRRSGTEQAAAARAAGTAADLMAGLRVLRGIGAERVAAGRYRDTSDASRDAAIRAARLDAVRAATVLALTGAFVAVVGIVAGRMALDGTLTVGQFVTSVTLTQFLIGPFNVITHVTASAARARASAGRLADVLDAPPVVTAGAPPAAAPPSDTTADSTTGSTTDATADRRAAGLDLQGLRLGDLEPLDLSVDPGELVGVVLTDESAVADLLDFLGRRADPPAGRVLLDGTALTDLEPAAVRASVLVAEHDGVLFGGTLAENVAAAARDDDAVALALTCAAVDEIAESLPDGTDSPVGESGGLLSGGQRQRVALARALAADPPVLVLHEPTTAVDSVTESRIAARLAELRRERTTLIVTSSPVLLSTVTRVVVIGPDGVEGDGRHADLLTRHSGYREAVLA
ncbi:ATP-binding cassette domain-containing protein [Streptomyces sp. SID5785]|uniref:ABC transporter transmembrane domain-containing protein n=1 Tax=Streptomyces sp. SID5785 TaxID=2690309 RepID=UPI001361A884|nr:ABC transporter ATP-binding protein [Streptomyces sp. SID5785]MZD05769.1 ATP-binding cassette domain-containing protein [Streptomyces sp. SID5785]